MAAGEESRKSAFVLARIRRVQRRLNLETALTAAVTPAWVAVTLISVWRFEVQRHVGLFAALTVAAAVVAWRAMTRKKGVSLEQAAVIADRRANAGGLLLTRLETGVGEWELGLNDRVRALTPPPIRVRRAVAGLSAAIVFVVVAMLVPLPVRLVTPINAAGATKLDALQEKLDAVAKEEPLDDAAKAELERLKDELADNAFDAADWEAADTLDKELDRKAQEAGAELSRAEEAAKELSDAMATAQSADAANREKEELESALMQLSDGQAADPQQAMAQAMGEAGEKKEGETGKEGQESGAPKPGPSQSQLGDLRQALQKRQDALQKSYGQGNGPQQPQQSAQRPPSGKGKGSGKGKEKGDGEGEGGEDGTGEGEGKTGQRESKDKEHASHATKAGAGHGDADDVDLIFGGQAEMDPNRLKFQPLPQGQGGEDPGELWGLKAANPKKNSTGHANSGSGSSAVGEQAPGNREGLLLPRNRALIQKYFDNPSARNP